VTVTAPGVTVSGGSIADPEGNVFNPTTAKPARQAIAVSNARIPVRRVRADAV
jgi:hypothetical protein